MNVKVSKSGEPADRYKSFLKLVGPFYGFTLSDKELEVMNSIYWETGGKLSTEARKKVADSLKMSEFNLNNYLLKLRRKSVITDAGIIDQLLVNVAPSEREFSITFTILS